MARILLVDDEPAVRGSLARYLARQGHRVEQAANGREALELLESTDCDLVITDVNMPEMSGIEVLTTITELRPDVPVIAMSGGGLLDKSFLLEDAGALGAVSTIQKPFDLDELGRLVEEALAEDR